MKQDLRVEVSIPEGVTVTVESGLITAKGPKGETSRNLEYPGMLLSQAGGNVVIEAKQATKREKRMLGTFQSHVKNVLKGAAEGYVYELKICSGHFPMSVEVLGKEVAIKNFLGENFPRKVPIKDGVTVKVEGDKIVVESTSKELAGQMAASIEQATVVKGRDVRIFQDGCYITNKGGKVIQ